MSIPFFFFKKKKRQIRKGKVWCFFRFFQFPDRCILFCRDLELKHCTDPLLGQWLICTDGVKKADSGFDYWF